MNNNTTQLSFSTYQAQTQELPKVADTVTKGGRRFTITNVIEDDARIVLTVIAHDTGLDGVLFLHEIDAHFTR